MHKQQSTMLTIFHRSTKGISIRARVTIAICTCFIDALALGVQKTWTVPASVETRYIIGSDEFDWAVASEPALPIVPSPDGRRFLFVTRRGDLRLDANVFELFVYDTIEVTAALKSGLAAPLPIARLVRCSTTNTPAIAEPVWMYDNSTILFTGCNTMPTETNSAVQYKYDIQDKGVRLVCDTPREGEADDPRLLYADNKRALFVDESGIAPRDRRTGMTKTRSEIRYPSAAMTPDRFLDTKIMAEREGYYFSDFRASYSPKALGLFFTDGRSVKRLAELGKSVDLSDSYGNRTLVRVSPSGKTILLLATGEDGTEATWRKYDASGKPFILQLFGHQQNRGIKPVSRFMALDVATGTLKPLFDAPSGMLTEMGRRAAIITPPDIVWERDEECAILVNTAVPIRDSKDKDTAFIVSWRPRDRSFQKIVPIERTGMRVKNVHVDRKRLTIEWQVMHERGRQECEKRLQGTEAIRSQYELRNGVWQQVYNDLPKTEGKAPEWAGALAWSQPEAQSAYQAREAAANNSPAGASWLEYRTPQAVECSNGLKIVLSESASTPQRLMASFGRTTIALLDRDSRTTDVAIAESTTIEWKTADGRLHRGLLTLPPVAGIAPPPLVIQIYKYMPNVFRPDGFVFTGYAKQALVARGMAVLEMSLYDLSIGTQKEIPDLQANVEAALDTLCKDRLINPEKLGVLGFSRGGYNARNVLTHPGRYRFRAAAAHDSFYTGVNLEFQRAFLAKTRYFRSLDSIQPLFGGAMWDEPAVWLRDATDLSAIRATGALLETVNVNDPLLLSQHIITFMGSYYSVQRPIEYMVFPYGQHQLQMPRERYDSLSSTVDWMDFWLNEHERTKPCADAGETQEMLNEKYTRWEIMRADWERQQAWESAGHPAGSIPATDFEWRRSHEISNLQRP